LWFLPHIHVILVPGYTLCPFAEIETILHGYFCGKGAGNAPGDLRIWDLAIPGDEVLLPEQEWDFLYSANTSTSSKKGPKKISRNLMT
jgi:hypothetical protein